MKNVTALMMLFTVVLFLGCSTKTETVETADPIEQFLREHQEPLDNTAEQALAESARHFIGRRDLTVDGQHFRRDCSGTVSAIFAAAGCPLVIDVADERGGTASIYASLEQRNLVFTDNPRPGDLVFFDNTYDRNDNGMLDDELSHIGVVTAVDDSGNIDFVHYGSGRIKENRLNIRIPDEHKNAAGQLLNDFVRVKKSDDQPGTQYLTGQLVRSFGRWPACSTDR